MQINIRCFVYYLFQSDLSSSTSVDFRYLLYITDDSLDHTDYRIIKVKDTCHIQQPIRGTIMTKDVLHSNGNSQIYIYV